MPEKVMNKLIYVPFDQLNQQYGALKTADPKSDHIVLIESQRMLSGRSWHKQRLQFLVSSARHFAKELETRGFSVTYLKSATTVTGLSEVQAKFPKYELICATPNSFKLRQDLKDLGVHFVENDFFLTSSVLFTIWAHQQKSYTMENFYRAQRKRLNILMSGDKPVGGTWNYDAENRLPPPKQHDWGKSLTFIADEIDLEVTKQLPENTWGNLTEKVWATTRSEALVQMQHFFENHFKDFGPYEDAMPATSWTGHHSLLSPYLNNGLLHPSEVVAAAIAKFDSGEISISSCEGFIRQIIGWREYINGMYWYLGEDYRNSNGLEANRKLLPLFHDPTQTEMNCVKSVVQDVQNYGWTHHIPRLMVLSNLALLTGSSPQEFLNWMREVFIDAADWVMVPNVIGMATHADHGVLMTKPYAAGGAYISRMSEFCKPCKYDPKKRTGDDACPFTTLYWDFLDRNLEHFKNNHRMFQQINGLKRLSDLPQVRVRAHEVLSGLDAGSI
jgi:deoxyribodipyrimidine photolyase-related protein